MATQQPPTPSEAASRRVLINAVFTSIALLAGAFAFVSGVSVTLSAVMGGIGLVFGTGLMVTMLRPDSGLSPSRAVKIVAIVAVPMFGVKPAFEQFAAPTDTVVPAVAVCIAAALLPPAIYDGVGVVRELRSVE